MKPYRLKHIPTGLYYQPHKHGGSNLSKRGKIYQTSTHGLSYAMKFTGRPISIQCSEDGQVHKLTKHILNYEKCTWAYKQVIAETKQEDWTIEEI